MKMMKTCFLSLCFCFAMSTLGFGQVTLSVPPSIDTVGYISGLMNEPDSSYWDISELAQFYFSTTSDSIPETFAKEYGRWSYFWKTRVDSTGNRKTMNEAILEAVTSPGGVCQDNGDWKLLGPVGITKQVSGIVTAVYAPPGQAIPPPVIYIGSNTAGVWKTINGGQNWRCITDTLRVPALGINSIIGDPIDTSKIWIATGITGSFRMRYGVGIYQSDNGGESWDTTSLSWGPVYGHESYKLLMDPIDTDTIYALGKTRFHRSFDGGNTFDT